MTLLQTKTPYIEARDAVVDAAVAWYLGRGRSPEDERTELRRACCFMLTGRGERRVLNTDRRLQDTDRRISPPDRSRP